MGGRGKDIGSKYHQIDTKEHMQRVNINRIIEKSEETRRLMQKNGSCGGDSSPLLEKCACCGRNSIPVNKENAICGVCGWIDDVYQNMHPESTDGSNPVCLNTARENFIKYGKCIYDKVENSGDDKTSIIDFILGS